MTANSQALRELADDIEANGPDQPTFNMNTYVSGPGELRPICHTAACIAGYALFKWDRGRFLHCASAGIEKGFGDPEEQFAADNLGLSEQQTIELFTPTISFSRITKQVAVTMLRWLADNPDAMGHEMDMAWKRFANPKTKRAA